jgi:hypothetical protein
VTIVNNGGWMDIDEKIALAKGLIAKREEIDAQLSELLGGAVTRKSPRCSICGDIGHRATTCPSKPAGGEAQAH